MAGIGISNTSVPSVPSQAAGLKPAGAVSAGGLVTQRVEINFNFHGDVTENGPVERTQEALIQLVEGGAIRDIFR